MNHDLEDVSEHIKELGLGILAQAQRNLLTGTWDLMQPPQINCQIFGILQAAHAAELLIKAACRLTPISPAFRRYTLAFLRATLENNPEAQSILQHVAKDAALKDVTALEL